MPYTVCSKCGQNALPVATRCPRCGNPFEEQFMGRTIQPPAPRKAPVLVLVAGAALTLFVANALMQRLSTPAEQAGMTLPPKEKVAPSPAPRAEPPSQAVAATTESLPAAPKPEPKPPADSVARPATSALAVQAPAPAPAPVRAPAPAASERERERPDDSRRYATTWINVRATRRNSAAILRVLRPGEAVQVDSLSQGWYRVVSTGSEPGYVDRRLLDTAPGAATP